MSTVKVAGEVVRVFSKGFDLVEEHTAQSGQVFRQRFTVWTDDRPTEHAWAEVEGLLSAKVGKPWTDRNGETHTSVDLSINRPTVKVTGSTEQGRQRDETTSEPGYTGERVYGRQPGAEGRTFDDSSTPF